MLAERVASAGNHVIAVARRADRLAELAPNLLTPVSLDLTSERAGDRSSRGSFARPEVWTSLSNNAGYGLFATIEETDDQGRQGHLRWEPASLGLTEPGSSPRSSQ